jgi:hypothetical protein
MSAFADGFAPVFGLPVFGLAVFVGFFPGALVDRAMLRSP